RGEIGGSAAAERASRVRGSHAREDYAEFLTAEGLDRLGVGVPRAVFFQRLGPAEAPVIDSAVRALAGLGATVVDPADIETAREVTDFRSDVMLYEFKRDLNRYLQGLGEASPLPALRALNPFKRARQ